jgi:hypothetical protein
MLRFPEKNFDNFYAYIINNEADGNSKKNNNPAPLF